MAKFEDSAIQTDRIIEIAEQHGFSLDKDKLNLNQSGMDFLTTFAQSQEDGRLWVLRMPYRQDVIDRMFYERDVLRLVGKHLSISVPNWKIVTKEMVAYPLLAGTPAGTIDPELGDYVWHIDPKSPPDQYVSSLASTMAELHEIGLDKVLGAGLRINNHEQIRQSMAENMEKTRKLLDVDDSRWATWQEWLVDDSYWPPFTVFTHGDLHPGHTLLAKDFTLTGLIDWTEASISDPAIDFTSCYAAFGEATLDRLINYYKESGGRCWPRMKDHIIKRWKAYSIDIALFALSTGKEEHLRMAKESLSWI